MHRIGRDCFSPPPLVGELPGEVDDRAILVSGDDNEDDDDLEDAETIDEDD